MRKITTYLAFMSFVFGIVSCSDNQQAKPVELPAVAVTVNKMSGGAESKYVTASGRIEMEHSANISTRVMGYVTDIKVKIGQKVSKGQLLATISNSDLEAKKAQVEAGISQAMAAYNSAKKDYDRFIALFAQRSASQKEMDDVTTHFEMAKAGLETAKQMRNEVMAQFSYTNITAPFQGVITGTFVKEGDMANPGMPLLSIEGGSMLQAVVMVAESDISQIKEGTTAEVTVKSLGQTVKGRVTEVSTSARNTGSQYIVKINLNQTENILSGMFVNAVFPIEKTSIKTGQSLLLIPQEAIVYQGQLKGVYVINDQNKAILRWLRLGKTFGDQIEVLSGLSSEEQYVVKADGRLFNGVGVTIQ